MTVGRSHIAATVNTLFLAYVGAGLPLLVVLLVSRQPAALVFNDEVIVTEIVRTLVGSLGIVAAIPLTTFIASALRGSDPRQAGWSEATSPRLSRVAGVSLIIVVLLALTAALPITSGPPSAADGGPLRPKPPAGRERDSPSPTDSDTPFHRTRSTPFASDPDGHGRWPRRAHADHASTVPMSGASRSDPGRSDRTSRTVRSRSTSTTRRAPRSSSAPGRGHSSSRTGRNRALTATTQTRSTGHSRSGAQADVTLVADGLPRSGPVGRLPRRFDRRDHLRRAAHLAAGRHAQDCEAAVDVDDLAGHRARQVRARGRPRSCRRPRA